MGLTIAKKTGPKHHRGMDRGVHLTKKEEAILDGEEGGVLAKMMKLLVTLGEIGGAERLIPIRRSQIAGVSYKTAGDPTLELIEDIADQGVRVKTLATLNPAGMDLKRWREMGVSEGFAEKQLRICRAYERLGAEASCTCTPYHAGNVPSLGEVVGFSESSAVAFVNSYLGARTNRHGGLDALAAAILGRVPLMGFLLDENRGGDLLVRVKAELKCGSDHAALGYYVGKTVRTGEVPVYDEMGDAGMGDIKLLGAASAASGSVALFHVLGLTPEAKDEGEVFKGGRPAFKLDVTEPEIRSVYEELSTADEPDLIAVGCPHCHLKEIRNVADMLSDRKVKDGVKLWLFTSPAVFNAAERAGYIDIIRSAGGDVFKHTCMVVAPIEEMGFRSVYTNSAKAAFYIPRMTKGQCMAALHPLRDCVRMCLK